MSKSKTAPKPQLMPPIVYLAFAGGLGCATFHLLGMGQSGVKWATLAGAATGVLTVAQVISAFDSQIQIRAYRRIKREYEANAGKHGQSSFASEPEIAQSELNSKTGIFLGAIRGRFGRMRDLVYDGQRAVLVLAPAGAEKSMSIAVPTLLTDVKRSYVVTDLSGELFALTSEARRRAGNRIVCLCPWASEMSDRLDMEVKDAGLNIFSSINPKLSPETLKDEIALRSALVLPGTAKEEAKFRFFRDTGRECIEAVALKAFAEQRTPTLAEVREVLKSTGDLNEFFASMASYEDFGRLLIQYGRSLGMTMNSAPEQFMASVSTATLGLTCYDSFGPMAAHSQGGFDPSTLKDDVPTTVYIIWPGERLHTHQAPLNTTISYLIEMVARDPRLKTVRFCLDEVFNCGYLGNLVRAMAQYRKQGVQCILFGQTASQGMRIYSQEGFRDIMNLSDVVATTGMVEHESLKLLSAMAGEAALADIGISDPRGAEGFEPPNRNLSHRTRPLLRAEEIRRMPSSDMLIFHRNLPVIRCTKVPYWTRPSFAALAGKNPYYRG